MKERKTWTCPKCGREVSRNEGQEKMRCSCGAIMDATIDFEEDGQICKKVLGRLED